MKSNYDMYSEEETKRIKTFKRLASGKEPKYSTDDADEFIRDWENACRRLKDSPCDISEISIAPLNSVQSTFKEHNGESAPYVKGDI